MNKLRILGLLLATALFLSSFTACSPDGEKPLDVTTTTPGGEEITTTTDSSATTNTTENITTTAGSVSSQNSVGGATTTEKDKVTTTTARTTPVTSVVATTTAPAGSDYDNSYFNYRDGLLNTYVKLKKDKKLTIAYMGGSVTYGIGTSDLSKSYRARTTAWLQEKFPDATITEVNAGVPSACSAFGAHWVNEKVLSEAPDLVFLEYAINDYYARSIYSETDVSRHYETIIRKLRQANPKCDIVALYTTDNTVSQLNTPYFDQVTIQDEIAARYGIPSVHMGYQACQELNLKNGNSSAGWSTYFSDGVHPTAEGYARYASVLTRCLTTALIDAPAKLSNVTAVNKTMPAAKNSNLIMNSRYIAATDLVLESNTGWNKSTSGKGVGGFVTHEGDLYTNTANNEFTFKFTGKDVALFCDLFSCTVSYSIDGSPWASTTTNNHPMRLGKNSLEYGEHTVTIKCNNPSGKRFDIAGILVS